MRTSSDHILTSHAGSLPRPDNLIEANRAREAGEATNERGHSDVLRNAVADVVRRQRELGMTSRATVSSAKRRRSASITAPGGAIRSCA
jgi:methionine synthase II (cobalamin-independent)